MEGGGCLNLIIYWTRKKKKKKKYRTKIGFVIEIECERESTLFSIYDLLNSFTSISPILLFGQMGHFINSVGWV